MAGFAPARLSALRSERSVSPSSIHMANMVRSTGFAPARVTPGASQASLSTGSSTTALKWGRHRDVRPAPGLTETLRRYLRFVGETGGSGRIRTGGLLLMGELR